MKHKGILITAVIVILILILGAPIVGAYNSMVTAKADVEKSFADIDTQLQRRSDLIPNLLASVKGYMNHEQEIMTAVADARSKLIGAGSAQDKIEANNELDGALSRLLMVTENYPELKADKQFTALNDELAGTENRIAVARRDYNEKVKQYNTGLRVFPKNIVAGIFGFSEEPYFEADDSAKTVPKVEF